MPRPDIADSTGPSSFRLDPIALFLFVAANWKKLSLFGLLGGSLAYAASFVLPATYKAEAIALPVKEQQGMLPLGSLMSDFGSLATLAGLGLPSLENPAELAVTRLRSRGFIEGFIEEQDLLPVIFQSQWDSDHKSWSGHRAPPTLYDGYLLMRNDVLRVAVDKRNGTINLEVRWRDPITAARWANQLVERLNRITRERAIEDADRSISYLKNELEKANSVDLRQSISMLLESQMNLRMLAVTQPDFALKVVDGARPVDVGRAVSPRRGLLAALGFAFGVIIGALAVWSRTSLPRRLETP